MRQTRRDRHSGRRLLHPRQPLGPPRWSVFPLPPFCPARILPMRPGSLLRKAALKYLNMGVLRSRSIISFAPTTAKLPHRRDYELNRRCGPFGRHRGGEAKTSIYWSRSCSRRGAAQRSPMIHAERQTERETPVGDRGPICEREAVQEFGQVWRTLGLVGPVRAWPGIIVGGLHLVPPSISSNSSASHSRAAMSHRTGRVRPRRFPAGAGARRPRRG